MKDSNIELDLTQFEKTWGEVESEYKEKYVNNSGKENQLVLEICDGKRSTLKQTEKEIWGNYNQYLENSMLKTMFAELVDDGIDKDTLYLLKYSVEENEFIKQKITLTPVKIVKR